MQVTVLFSLLISMHKAWSFNLRILGGEDASESDYPYVVKIMSIYAGAPPRDTDRAIGRKHVCTGAVLTQTWTLTAGHCVSAAYRLVEKDVVRKNVIWAASVATPASAGAQNSSGIIVDIKAFHKHPAFKDLTFTGKTYLENNVAMVHTDPLVLKEYVKVSAIDYGGLLGHEAKSIGYGVSSNRSRRIDNKPLQVLPVILVECPKGTGIYPVVCAASRCSTQRPVLCGPDGGGPLIHPAGLIAITSWNPDKDCYVPLRSRRPDTGKLTPISPYLTWITSHIISAR